VKTAVPGVERCLHASGNLCGGLVLVDSYSDQVGIVHEKKAGENEEGKGHGSANARHMSQAMKHQD
jgi:hypothetical protein